MAGPRPTCERPPKGLDAWWSRVWNHALKVMRDQGTWGWELKPLLDEYVFALRAAQACRDGFAWLDHLGECVASEDIDWITLGQIAGGLPTQWDRHAKRALVLADKLVLTPEARKRYGIHEEEGEPSDPFACLDAPDELARRRGTAASVAG